MDKMTLEELNLKQLKSGEGGSKWLHFEFRVLRQSLDCRLLLQPSSSKFNLGLSCLRAFIIFFMLEF